MPVRFRSRRRSHDEVARFCDCSERREGPSISRREGSCGLKDPSNVLKTEPLTTLVPSKVRNTLPLTNPSGKSEPVGIVTLLPLDIVKVSPT